MHYGVPCGYTLWNSKAVPPPVRACITGCPVGILCGTAQAVPPPVRACVTGYSEIYSLYTIVPDKLQVYNQVLVFFSYFSVSPIGYGLHILKGDTGFTPISP